jgi:SH3 domain protein
MKRFKIIGLSLGLVFLSSACWAETAYIAQILSISVRSGQGAGYEIVSSINTGTQVEVLSQGNGWTRIRTDTGVEGWIPARYLTQKPPERLSPEELTNLEAVQAENSQLKSTIAEKEQKINELQESYETLKADSSGFISVRKKLEEAHEAMAKLNMNSENLKKTIEAMEKDRLLKGALIGAGILLAGILIGLNFKKQRRRSSTLLS